MATSRPSAPLRAVALPSEHGGWSLTAEPAVLGLLVAWSSPGLAIGLAGMVAFVARTPIKVVLVDRFRHRWLDRTRLALGVAAVELAVLAGLVVVAVTGAESGFWVPFAVAAPLIALELWYDMRSRSRRLIPELAGAIGIGSLAAAVALADGGVDDSVAWGLWIVIGARSAAAIPYVRTQILRVHGRDAPNWHSDVAQLAATVAAAMAWLADLIPLASVVAITLVAAINTAAVRSAPRRAVVIGIQQTVLGIAVIVVTAVAVRLG